MIFPISTLRPDVNTPTPPPQPAHQGFLARLLRLPALKAHFSLFLSPPVFANTRSTARVCRSLRLVQLLSDGIQENTLASKMADTHLGLGAVVLLDDGPVVPVQAVSHPEPLHEDVFVSVFPSLDHHAG